MFTIRGEYVFYQERSHTRRFGPIYTKRGMALRTAKRMSRYKHIYDYIVVIKEDDHVVIRRY